MTEPTSLHIDRLGTKTYIGRNARGNRGSPELRRQ